MQKPGHHCFLGLIVQKDPGIMCSVAYIIKATEMDSISVNAVH